MGRLPNVCVVMLNLVNDATGSVNPFAAVIDLGAGLDGFEHSGGRWLDVFRIFNEMGDGGAEVQHTAFPEPGGVSMAVDGAEVFEVVVGSNAGAVVPVKEVEFDVFAVFMVADCAFAGVAVERR